MSKYPKRIQEIIDNQGKIVKKGDKEIQEAIIDIEKANEEEGKRIRASLGC